MRCQRITLIRHAHPNPDQPSDPSLSDMGRKQALTLDGHFQLVVLGPLRRQLDTYTHSNISGDKMAMSELLREQRSGKAYNYYRNEIPKAETRDDAMVRVKALKEWLRKQPETDICMITSAFLICYFLDSCEIPRGLIGYCQRFELEI